MISARQPKAPPSKRQKILSELNEKVEVYGTIKDIEEVWTEWIWGSNPEETFEPSILMNRSHLLGLIACRHMSNMEPPSAVSSQAADERMSLVAKQPSAFSLRELRDTVDNLLIEWPQFVVRLSKNPNAAQNLDAVARLIDGCFARLGVLAQHPAQAAVFDDAASTEPHAGGLIRLSRPGLRRMLGSFLVLYRHLDLLGRAQQAPAPQDQFEKSVRKHHVEASTDDFHLLCMNMLLPAAAKLNYKQDFPGMYNHVSQVVYFHNTQYERTPRAELAEILATGEPMQALPAICQIHPEIELAYEEDGMDLSGPTGKWRWLVLPRRVYLVDPDAGVHHSEDVWDLLALYLRATTGAKKTAPG
jgi:hypothetical protein